MSHKAHVQEGTTAGICQIILGKLMKSSSKRQLLFNAKGDDKRVGSWVWVVVELSQLK